MGIIAAAGGEITDRTVYDPDNRTNSSGWWWCNYCVTSVIFAALGFYGGWIMDLPRCFGEHSAVGGGDLRFGALRGKIGGVFARR